MNDKQIQDKLEGLNALEGGIVYAKEDAWDKLQSRMDKPAKKIWILPARLAAAAVLLLMACAGGYYYMTDTSDNKITVAQPTTLDTQAVIELVTVKQIPAPEIALPIKTTKTNKRKYDKPHIRISTKQPEIITIQPNPQPQPETIATVDTQAIPEPTTAPKIRVVHINNLGKPITDDERPAYVYNGPRLDISKMKIVSINDVQRYEMMHQQEEDMIRMVRINRPHGDGFFTVSNPFGRNYSLYSPSTFSIRLNRNK
jgi:hypothetical protein